MKLKVYLADLTHTGRGVATEAFPLNVGLIASYALKYAGDDLDIRLFKYPNDLLTALRQESPDILGLSNYTWNSNLARYFSRLAKAQSPSTLVVWGGTNYPFDEISQEKFLRARPELDMHIYYEGEQSFAEMLKRRMGQTEMGMFESPLGGIQFLRPESGEFVSGPTLPRLRELDAIPSPYVTGLLDPFFDGILTPLVETTRGCPFRCNFCNAGAKYFDKVNMFSDDYVKDELTYIAKKAAPLGIVHVTMADNNFGMYPRDKNTAEVLHELRHKYGWPKSVTAWTGKNSKERVIEVTRLMGEILSISMSVQSMDTHVLKKISRDNIKIEAYTAISEELNRQGRAQHSEVIMPLPGETYQSHISGLNKLMNLKVSRVMSHTLQMLHGTPYKDDVSYVRDHGYKTKWRLVPLDFSEINGEYVFDTEEVAIETTTFSFAEYIEARKYLFVADLCFNSGPYDPLKKYLRSLGIEISAWIIKVHDSVDKNRGQVGDIYRAFAKETQDELWSTEEELVRHYSSPETYEKLISGDVGGNVLFKHRVWMLSSASEPWTKIAFDAAREIITEKLGTSKSLNQVNELTELELYVMLTLSESFVPNLASVVKTGQFYFDILTWLELVEDSNLSDFAVAEPIIIEFSYSEHKLSVMTDGFRRYGTDLSGLIKLIQRNSFSFTRSASYGDSYIEKVSQNTADKLQQIIGPGYTTM